MALGAVTVDGRDFFAAQRRLRWQSAALVVGLFLLLWAIVNFLSGVHTTKACPAEYTYEYECETVTDWSIPGLIITAVAVAAYLVIGPLLTSRWLVPDHGARPAEGPDTTVFLNVVEEMAIASGVPVPRAFILDDPALNAYAVSDGRRHGAVVVTSGLLTALDRRELGGVVAHELAHIRNRDSRVMFVAVYAVGAIIVAALFFVVIATSLGRQTRRLRRGSVRWFAMLCTLMFAVLAAIFRFGAVPAALLLRAALSRQREELADASAVQFTRDPTGLRTALEKIAATDNTPKVPLLARALCIESPHGTPTRRGVIERWMEKYPPPSLGRWEHTHPPIAERIAWLRSLEGALGGNS